MRNDLHKKKPSDDMDRSKLQVYDFTELERQQWWWGCWERKTNYTFPVLARPG